MSILDHAKDAVLLAKKFNDQELYQKIVDLRDEIFALKEESASLKDRLKESEAALTNQKRLKRDGNKYVFADDPGSGPFCLACWDGDRKLINLIVTNSKFGTTIRCARCNRLTGKAPL